jgi:predicted Zn-dependent protease
MRPNFKPLLIGVVAIGSIVLHTALPVHAQKNIDQPDKIGHRTVAHKAVISPENEHKVGEQLAEVFVRSVILVQDPVVEQFVTTLAENVIRNSDLKGPVAVKVLRSPEIESLSLPGGHIFITSGLLLAADNDDQVAGAIAHQVAHAAARHWALQITKVMIAQYALVPLIVVPTDAGAHTQSPTISSQSAPPVCAGFPNRGSDDVPLMFLKVMRNDELEADYLGLQYVYKAGYDPSEYIVLLQKLAPIDADSQGHPDAFRAVPPLSERIGQAKEEIRKILPNARQSQASPEFVQMKSRL